MKLIFKFIVWILPYVLIIVIGVYVNSLTNPW